MRHFWLFRSNLKNLEYYHEYKELEEFEKKCHDYYMLLGLWLLRNDHIDKFTVWRLSDNPIPDINFNVDGKLYSQKWVRHFDETMRQPSPKFSLFRGGFPEYDALTLKYPDKLGKKLYLGTGKRVYPKYGGKYDIYLQEDKGDFVEGRNCLPFYKTASPEVFHPVDTKIKYDICWPANFTQHKYKGQKFFMNVVGHCPKLKRLKIVHCGNNPEAGRKMARQHNVTNIEFVGSVDRPTLNIYLNQSKFGLVLSNKNDGCPRIATEILMAGTPLIIRKTTRLLPYYKQYGVVGVNDNNIIPNIMAAFTKWNRLKLDLDRAIKKELSFNTICQKNIDLWESA
jgi:hypothetical protein